MTTATDISKFSYIATIRVPNKPAAEEQIDYLIGKKIVDLILFR